MEDYWTECQYYDIVWVCLVFGNCNHCCFCCGHPFTMLGVRLFISLKNKIQCVCVKKYIKKERKKERKNGVSKSVPLGIPNCSSLSGGKLKQRWHCVDSKKENKLEQRTKSIAHLYEQCGLL